jgi:hypothetical protein
MNIAEWEDDLLLEGELYQIRSATPEVQEAYSPHPCEEKEDSKKRRKRLSKAKKEMKPSKEGNFILFAALGIFNLVLFLLQSCSR